jgi:hypothetical protein
MSAQLRIATGVTLVCLVQVGCFDYSGPVLERRTAQSFTVAPGSLVQVAIHGGPITVETGPAGRVRLELLEEVYAPSERDGRQLLDAVDVSMTQERNEVRLVAKRLQRDDWRVWSARQLRFSAILTVPPDVRTDLDTSGGTIRVHGLREAAVTAGTSGGSIRVDGGRAPLTLDTSGGSIKVGQALTALDADTSGGGITVDYVGPNARTVRLETSGGGIRVGIDADARLDINASTSGGTVDVDGLPLDSQNRDRSQVTARLNGGGGQLRAATSGGGIHIARADASDARTD